MYQHNDNSFSPIHEQAIISANIGLLLIGSLGINQREIVIDIQQFQTQKINLKSTVCKRTIPTIYLPTWINHDPNIWGGN